MPSVAISASRLTKRFGDRVAVDGVDFDVEVGECFGLLGPNGAGKTTTVRMIHAFTPITAGDLVVLGLRVDDEPVAVKRRLGVVPQEENLDPDLTPWENLMVFARYFDIPRAEARRRAADLLEFVGLTSRAASPLDELSGGMKRRLLIARALLNQPELLILDEPTTGLDPQARHLVWQRLRALKAQGVTQVLTTHYMDEAAQLCDRVALMDAGRILRQGRPADLIRAEVGEEVIEIRGDEALHRAAVAALDGKSLRWERAGDTLYCYCADGRELLPALSTLKPAHLLHRPASLEDLFLKVAGRSLQE
ncbi:MAG: ATP-binding cassette domain-containing protein [candidate division NC10 bacterium]|nr:ATP-binding cassette domain-containing protein [candidate division NC10 bacterium]MBI2163344.1 ATP-binding cassette domain-containing protein [candidate division NC10 bacterium]